MSFPKMNTKVSRYKCFDENPISMIGEAYVRQKSIESKIEKEKAKMEEQMTHQKEKYYTNKIINENIVTSGIIQNQIFNAIQDIEPGMKTVYFKKIIGDFVIESLVLDEEFITQYESAIRNVVSDYIDEFGSYNKFLAIEQKSNSPLLNRIKTLCEKMSKKSCGRKLKEAEDANSIDTIDLSISQEEEDDFESMKGDLDVEKISELVKDKVVAVIKDEREREAKEKEVIDEIKSELEEEKENNTSEDEDIDVEESLNSFLDLQRNRHVEEGTLFFSLMNQTYKLALESKMEKDDDDDDEDEDDIEDIFEDGDCDDDDDKDDDDEDEDDIYDVEENTSKYEINMDEILTEAIVKYTIMETFYTLQLESYTSDDIKRLTTNMLNPPQFMLTEGSILEEGIMDKVRKKLQDRYAKKILLSPKQVEKLDVEKQKERITAMINNSKTVADCDFYKKELLRDIGLKSLKQRYPDVSPELVKKALSYDKWLNTTAQSIIAKKRKELSSLKESFDILDEGAAKDTLDIALDFFKKVFSGYAMPHSY